MELITFQKPRVFFMSLILFFLFEANYCGLSGFSFVIFSPLEKPSIKNGQIWEFVPNCHKPTYPR